MARYIGRRLLLMVPTLVLVSILVFALSEVLPGDIGRVILGPYASQSAVTQLDHKLGMDKPIYVRYVEWAGHFLTGHLGYSYQYTNETVASIVWHALGNSLLLGGLALVVIVPTSILVGVVAGLRRDSLLDRAITIFSLSMTAMPEFVTGIVLVVIFSVMLGWLPSYSMPQTQVGFLDRLHYLILPAIPLMLVELGYVARMARAGTATELERPYIRTATLKGLPRRRVVFAHVLRNAMVPTVTVIGSQIGWLIGGLVVVETLFSYNGIGNYTVHAALNHDQPLLEACVLVIAVVYMVANLVADVVVAMLNPRIRKTV